MKNSSNGSNELKSQNLNSDDNNFAFPSNKSDLHEQDKYRNNKD